MKSYIDYLTVLEQLSCVPDIGDVDLLAEFIEYLILDDVELVLQLTDLRTVMFQLTSQISDHQLYR